MMPKLSLRVLKLLSVLGLVSLLLMACGSDANPSGSQGSSLDENSVTLPIVVVPEKAAGEDSILEGSEAAVSAATQALVQFKGAADDQIEVISVEAITWPDSCLGIPQSNMACAEAEVPGYRIVLQLDGATYEYHTDGTGDSVGLYQP
jgi:hypothetical protein